MDRTLIPHGLRAQLAAATRAQGAALASPAITAAQALAAVTGASAGLVSKWGSLDHAEAPSIEAAAVIEAASGAPHYARALAALTGHEVVPIADAEAPRLRLTQAVVRLGGSAHGVVADLHRALADDVVTPAEAHPLLAAIGRLQSDLTSIAGDLARIAEGSP